MVVQHHWPGLIINQTQDYHPPYPPQPQPILTSIECDNCHEPFSNESQLDLHIEAYPSVCEDCGICFTSTINFDFHELKEHPDTTYAQKIIPIETKQKFSKSLQ